jgi:hypothetical protein
MRSTSFLRLTICLVLAGASAARAETMAPADAQRLLLPALVAAAEVSTGRQSPWVDIGEVAYALGDIPTAHLALVRSEGPAEIAVLLRRAATHGDTEAILAHGGRLERDVGFGDLAPVVEYLRALVVQGRFDDAVRASTAIEGGIADSVLGALAVALAQRGQLDGVRALASRLPERRLSTRWFSSFVYPADRQALAAMAAYFAAREGRADEADRFLATIDDHVWSSNARVAVAVALIGRGAYGDAVTALRTAGQRARAAGLATWPGLMTMPEWVVVPSPAGLSPPFMGTTWREHRTWLDGACAPGSANVPVSRVRSAMGLNVPEALASTLLDGGTDPDAAPIIEALEAMAAEMRTDNRNKVIDLLATVHAMRGDREGVARMVALLPVEAVCLDDVCAESRREAEALVMLRAGAAGAAYGIASETAHAPDSRLPVVLVRGLVAAGAPDAAEHVLAWAGHEHDLLLAEVVERLRAAGRYADALRVLRAGWPQETNGSAPPRSIRLSELAFELGDREAARQNWRRLEALSDAAEWRRVASPVIAFSRFATGDLATPEAVIDLLASSEGRAAGLALVLYELANRGDGAGVDRVLRMIGAHLPAERRVEEIGEARFQAALRLARADRLEDAIRLAEGHGPGWELTNTLWGLLRVVSGHDIACARLERP